MRKEQIIKILKVAIISTAIILLFEGIFDIPAVNNFFVNIITSSSGWLVWLAIWIIMFLQVTVLNIPAYVILSACTTIGMETLSLQYILCVLSAYMLGCVLAYWIGEKFGIKAVKWCAGSEEDYNKWSEVFNKKGKWFYFLTVLLPFFPDDIILIVVSSLKMDFKFYFFANLVGRGVGLTTMLLVLKLLGSFGGNFPYMLIVWAVALIVEIIALKVIGSRKYENKK